MGTEERPLLVSYAVAQTANALGAAASVGLMTYAGLRVGAPAVLMVLFPAWVLSPFIALAMGAFMNENDTP